jgi:hypothetical protein
MKIERRSTAAPLRTAVDTGDFFTPEELDKLILATIEGAGRDGITQAEVDRVIEWALVTRIRGQLLAFTLTGHFIPRGFRNGDLVFCDVDVGLPPEVASRHQKGFKGLEEMHHRRS